MQPLILHLMWHPHQTPTAALVWNDLLLQCAALSPRVEPFEQHEIFVDLTGTHSRDTAVQTLLLPVGALRPANEPSIAIALAPNKFVARLVSQLAFERTLPPTVHVRRTAHALTVHINPAQVQPLLDPLSVHALWCISQRVLERLIHLGITKIGELRRVPRQRLTNEFGFAIGQRLLTLANGYDPSVVQALYPPRTAEVYWDFGPEHIDHNQNTFTHVLHHLASELAAKLSALGLGCASLFMRIELREGTVGHGIQLAAPTYTPQSLSQHAVGLFQKFTLHGAPCRIHLIAGDLALPQNVQASLLPGHGRSLASLRADKILAVVQKRFGSNALQYASALHSLRRERMRALWHGTPR